MEAEGKETNWKETYCRIMQLAKEELGESKQVKYLEKESWWWNDAVQKVVPEKRRLFREWHKTRKEKIRRGIRRQTKNAKGL